MPKNRAPILMALTGIALSGCLASTEKLPMLPEPEGERSFIVGWQADRAGISDKEVHKSLLAKYNRAVETAASEMGWTLKPRILTNASNLSTTFDPAKYRSAALYGISAPDLGCEVTVNEDERVSSNCLISVNVGGLNAMETPEGVEVGSADSWAFGEAMRHGITLKSSDERKLPVLAFSKLVSASLPGSIYLYLPQDDRGFWLHQGQRIPASTD
ncbi:hypothetical protein [Marinobacter halotolerans]|uniref:hypothetical protein n=1 Tax=Marinobacter halotolerans TaxID=1569211 RepID=UPI0012447552|nr:hypothetical protein [Marinobacter halotolerans]